MKIKDLVRGEQYKIVDGAGRIRHVGKYVGPTNIRCVDLAHSDSLFSRFDLKTAVEKAHVFRQGGKFIDIKDGRHIAIQARFIKPLI